MEDEQSSLRDMMDRLRFATGKVAAAPVQEVTSTRIDEKCLLVIRQALCRHPALVAIHKTRDELKRQLMDQLQHTLQVENTVADDVGRMLVWMNETSEALEMERLSAVYSDVEQAFGEARQRMLDDLGIEALPEFSQYSVGDLSPWNVLFPLVTGPLLTLDESKYKRAEVQLPNPTPSMITDLIEVNKNVYSVSSWISLLNSLDEYPINAVRHVWHAATFFFPTSGPLVTYYLRKEINEVAKGRYLWDERHEDDAKETYRSYCRVLNCFFRHLPLCFSVELYRLFVDFLEVYIKPDDSGMENVFTTALQRDVGHCPASTDIWKKFLRWKGDKILDMYQRREWVRKLYIRMLRTPLQELQEVKEDYDYFVKTEYRGRPPPEGRVEERFVRARAAVAELNKLMGSVGGFSSQSSSTRNLLPKALYLPRPVRLHVDGAFDVRDEKEEHMHRSEVEAWLVWSTIIERESSTSAYAGIELFGYERVRFFLLMRTSIFPHEPLCWCNYADFCLEKQPLLSERERRVMVRDALERVSYLLPGNFYMRVAYCDYMLNNLGDPECAHRKMKELLMQQRNMVVDYVKGESLAGTNAVVSALEKVTLLSVNWMRWGSINREVTNTQFIRLVARFTMHRVDFLSLIMGVVRRAVRESKDFTPRRCQRAFNTFCHHWIRLELIRNGALVQALVILERWKDHLKMFVSSAKDKGWDLADCGVDEYFTSSCTDICHSDASVVSQVLGILEDLRLALAAVYSSPASGDFVSVSAQAMDTLLTQIESIRNTFFVVDKEANSLASYFKLPLDLVSTRIHGATVPLQTYDNCLFTSEWAGLEESSAFHGPTTPGGGTEKKFVNFPLQGVVEAMPDDTSWMPCRMNDRTSRLSGEKADGKQGAHTNLDMRSKKVSRPPNRRGLVTRSVLLKDLTLALRGVGGSSTVTGVPNVKKIEDMVKENLPTTYETDPLFKDKAVDTEWLLRLFENIPALC
ncbi:hypothetical protein, conserved [Trypanosoma brucei gambiense DAL972]|uniref:Suppressor of forked domain-containing protein n=1 Tax=Trypanosoma brucei gambiense (strain MHOM/CI/86/DAL972) TaxID=679716 RepID=D0AAK1_TRYB9|nr:hypothetical protein, conserved [Trypanosoma brucei gambiense DAL972]CBH18702.1 hypothetical protein, conserved [Trypanosoma brucei gambiense DAL972]|eukprot:XP_011780966.1 hypothetical protein, conserved [Trypanosoma brucei gambiense DAL972]